MKNILCIGAGYVGGPTMAVIAKHCPEYRVEVVDVNAARLAAWRTDDLPIYEPGLLDVVREARGRNLFFEEDIDGAIGRADIIFVSVNTPTKTFGEGAGQAADLQYWERTARQIAQCSAGPKIVVEKSTLPVRTAEAMEAILRGAGGEAKFDVVSNPEFLAEGTAVADLENPDRVLVGGHPTPSGHRAVEAVADIYRHWVPADRILTTNLWSSELSKLTANAFLAQRISSINAVSALCECSGADVREVGRAVGMDRRIGPHFLRAGVGFGGSCFRKDILNLVYLCRQYGLSEAADYWQQVVAMNEYRKRRVVRTMIGAMYNTLAGKRIAVLGFAFKPGTSDTRDTPALTICKLLLDETATLAITDPQALANARKDLADAPRCEFTPDPYAAAEGAHAVLVATGWPEYAALDFPRIHDAMAHPAFLFDGSNLLDHAALAEIGFRVYPIGAPPVLPAH